MSTELAVTEFPKASTALSLQLGLEPRVMLDALKSQFFKGKEATDAQMAVVVSIAKELRLNPLIPGQLYPYPDRSGSVTVMIGPDGVYTMLANNPDIVAQKDGGPAYYVEHGMENGKETCTGYINHRVKGLLKKTIWVDEWVVGSNPNWSARKHHMAEIRALKQAARMVIHGIPADSDERAISEMMDVTGSAEDEPKKERPKAPKREAKGVASVVENQPAKDAPIDVQATTVTEAPATPTAAQVQAAKEIEQRRGNMDGDDSAPPAKTVEPAKPAPRAFLKDAEEITAVCEIVTADPMVITATVNGAKGPQPSVQVKLKGGYEGIAYHIGGGIKDGDTVKPGPAWVVGATVAVKLRGKLNTNPKVNKVQVFVDGVEPVSTPVETMEA